MRPERQQHRVRDHQSATSGRRASRAPRAAGRCRASSASAVAGVELVGRVDLEVHLDRLDRARPSAASPRPCDPSPVAPCGLSVRVSVSGLYWNTITLASGLNMSTPTRAPRVTSCSPCAPLRQDRRRERARPETRGHADRARARPRAGGATAVLAHRPPPARPAARSPSAADPAPSRPLVSRSRASRASSAKPSNARRLMETRTLVMRS